MAGCSVRTCCTDRRSCGGRGGVAHGRFSRRFPPTSSVIDGHKISCLHFKLIGHLHVSEACEQVWIGGGRSCSLSGPYFIVYKVNDDRAVVTMLAVFLRALREECATPKRVGSPCISGQCRDRPLGWDVHLSGRVLCVSLPTLAHLQQELLDLVGWDRPAQEEALHLNAALGFDGV